MKTGDGNARVVTSAFGMNLFLCRGVKGFGALPPGGVEAFFILQEEVKVPPRVFIVHVVSHEPVTLHV